MVRTDFDLISMRESSKYKNCEIYIIDDRLSTVQMYFNINSIRYFKVLFIFTITIIYVFLKCIQDKNFKSAASIPLVNSYQI